MAAAAFMGLILFLALLLSLHPDRVASEPTQDKQPLLGFLNQVKHTKDLNWDESASVCDWHGVECDETKSWVKELRLPAKSLVGQIPANTLGHLTELRALSLHDNGLFGPIPPDFAQLKNLQLVYLNKNKFSGEFPPILTELTQIIRLDLSFNNFSGRIPSTLNNLTRLKGLFLQNNNFSGKIPIINVTSVNFANNNLSGQIPAALKQKDASAFENNPLLCGHPLPSCSGLLHSPPPPPKPNPVPPQKNHQKLSTGAVVGISVAGGLQVLLLLLAIDFFLVTRRKRTESVETPTGGRSSKDDVTGSAEGAAAAEGVAERRRLVFFQGGRSSCDLEDFLIGQGEVMGMGSIGTTYKAVTEEGRTVVVKRFQVAAAAKEEFEKQIEILEKMKLHENVLPLKGFCYSKREKLLVYDFLRAGSLSALLHGSRRRAPVNWDVRLRMAMDAGRGLAHLHESEKVVHGNIKSSNILLKHLDDLEACVSDFGLNALFSNPNHGAMGYRAPEVVDTRCVTFKSDVYSFGVLLLELVTGNAPSFDLSSWVQDVLDNELMKHNNAKEEEEMVQLLQIGKVCVVDEADQRPEMHEVLRKIEDIINARRE